MAVLLIVFGALFIGALLIVLIALTSPKPAPLDVRAERAASPLVDLDAEQFGKVVAVLLDKMGLELDRASGGKGGMIEMHALNPAPITGGKILIHCIPAPEQTGRVDGLMVTQFIRAVRSAYVSKGLLFTTGTIAPEARLEAEDAPIELFDRDQISSLIDTYLGSLTPEEIRRLG